MRYARLDAERCIGDRAGRKDLLKALEDEAGSAVMERAQRSASKDHPEGQPIVKEARRQLHAEQLQRDMDTAEHRAQLQDLKQVPNCIRGQRQCLLAVRI